jgi:hypothetical protein
VSLVTAIIFLKSWHRTQVRRLGHQRLPEDRGRRSAVQAKASTDNNPTSDDNPKVKKYKSYIEQKIPVDNKSSVFTCYVFPRKTLILPTHCLFHFVCNIYVPSFYSLYFTYTILSFYNVRHFSTLSITYICRPRYPINEYHKEEFEVRLAGGRNDQEGDLIVQSSF